MHYSYITKNKKNKTGVDKAEDALPYRHQGIAGRVTYAYNDRYFIEGNFGYNGSENFSPGHRFGFFPSVAAGWLVSNEKHKRQLILDMRGKQAGNIQEHTIWKKQLEEKKELAAKVIAAIKKRIPGCRTAPWITTRRGNF